MPVSEHVKQNVRLMITVYHIAAGVAGHRGPVCGTGTKNTVYGTVTVFKVLQ